MTPIFPNATGYAGPEVFAPLREAIRQDPDAADSLIELVADLLRFNTLLSASRAGADHLGAALSAAELLAELYFRCGNFDAQHTHSPNRDIFILSKGHAAPLHYATLAALGYFPTGHLDRLRRWGGLPGHSQACVPGVDGSTGSLGMGVSRAVGLAVARQRFEMAGDVYVLCGDGELQQGQVWEALLSAANFNCSRFHLVVDLNRVQTDQFVSDVLGYRDLAGTLTAAGFTVADCNGHSAQGLREAFARLVGSPRPRCVLASTIKGKGVRCMEHNVVLKQPGSRYVWHSRNPTPVQIAETLQEMLGRLREPLTQLGVEVTEPVTRVSMSGISEPECPSLVRAFGDGVLALARADERVVVLDCDMEAVCGLTPVRKAFATRFIELGIMQQHLCSMASALCEIGKVPVIASYAAFLTSRANEQLYNLATYDNARFVLAGHHAGVIPATPGLSHQAFRDIGTLRSIPGLLLYQPTGADDCKDVLEHFGRDEVGPMLYLRLAAAESDVELPTVSCPPLGHSQLIRPGDDAVILACGPVMVGESVAAAELLEEYGVSVEVRAHPWLTLFAPEMLEELAERGLCVVVVEDHHRLGGLGEGLFAAVTLAGLRLAACGHVAIEELPGCGARVEALEGMRIDRHAIAREVERALVKRTANSVRRHTSQVA